MSEKMKKMWIWEVRVYDKNRRKCYRIYGIFSYIRKFSTIRFNFTCRIYGIFCAYNYIRKFSNSCRRINLRLYANTIKCSAIRHNNPFKRKLLIFVALYAFWIQKFIYSSASKLAILRLFQSTANTSIQNMNVASRIVPDLHTPRRAWR